MKLGEDTAEIASIETKEFLKEALFNDSARTEQFVRDMQGQAVGGLAQCAERFDIFAKAFLEWE